LILYLTLVCSVAAVAALVVRYDMYDREPPAVLALAAALGTAAMAGAGLLERWTFRSERFTGEAAIAAVAALEEECLKLLVVAVIALLFRRTFNDPMDGIIYGSMSGAGMALEESFHAIRASHALGPLPPPVELVRICGHVIMGGISGFPFGLICVRHPAWPWALAVCGIGATSLHFGWDWIALTAPASGPLPPGKAVLGVGLMLTGLFAYGALVARASRWSHDLFAPWSPARLWGWPFRR
jgi:RsiW-degrading membrane proteinase PrsW (M82 family)